MEKIIFNKKRLAGILIFPTMAILVLFLYFPAWQSLIMSFFRSNLFLGSRKWIGWENYAELFHGPYAPGFIQVFIQSVFFSLFVVFGGLSLSVFLAVLANRPIRGRKVYQILLVLPFAFSPAVAATVFTFLLNPEIGLVNQVLSFLFGIKPRWLDSPVLTFFLAVFISIWKNMGYNIVFYLAALQNIHPSLYEAARIEGAGRRTIFFRLTLPELSPITFFLLFTNLTYSFFDTFGLIDILTKGGPVGRVPFNHTGVTSTLIYKIYQDGFGGSSNIGFASAQAMILFFLVIGITLIQFRFTKVDYAE